MNITSLGNKVTSYTELFFFFPLVIFSPHLWEEDISLPSGFCLRSFFRNIRLSSGEIQKKKKTRGKPRNMLIGKEERTEGLVFCLQVRHVNSCPVSWGQRSVLIGTLATNSKETAPPKTPFFSPKKKRMNSQCVLRPKSEIAQQKEPCGTPPWALQALSLRGSLVAARAAALVPK